MSDIKVVTLRIDDDNVCHPKAEEVERTLEAFQSIVGGLIQPVVVDCAMHVGTTMYVNEEGLLIGLPVNRLASELAWVPHGRYPLGWYGLVGDAVVLGTTEDGGDADCPRWVYTWFGLAVPS